MDRLSEKKFSELSPLEQMKYATMPSEMPKWPMFPILPLANIYDPDGDTRLGIIVATVYENTGLWCVFIGNAYRFFLKPSLVLNAIKTEFSSLEELVEAGWRVD